MISSFNLTDKLNSESIQILVNSKIKKISQHGFLSNISNASNKKNAKIIIKNHNYGNHNELESFYEAQISHYYLKY